MDQFVFTPNHISIYETTKVPENEFPKLKYIISGGDSNNVFQLIRILVDQNKKIIVDHRPHSLDSIQIRKFLLKMDKDFSIKVVARGDCLLGMIRLVSTCALVIVTESMPVAAVFQKKREIRVVKKLKYLKILNSNKFDDEDIDQDHIDLLENFMAVDGHLYYSFGYDVTRSLQKNMTGKSNKKYYNDKFLFNHYMANYFIRYCSVDFPLHQISRWIPPLIQGYCSCRVQKLPNNRKLGILLISRRSRHFAGTRYNKRGIQLPLNIPNEPNNDDDLGKSAAEFQNNQKRALAGAVANEVETELILFIPSKHSRLHTPQYCSMVIIRGSIPLFWTQNNSLSFQPEISMWRETPISAVNNHFLRLRREYGDPILALDLIRMIPSFNSLASTKEYKLSNAFSKMMTEIQKISKDVIKYEQYDFHNKKRENADLKGDIEGLVSKFVHSNGYFSHKNTIQSGVVRVNCIDCLDRTNAAQKCIVNVQLLRMLNVLLSSDEDEKSENEENMKELYQSIFTKFSEMFVDNGNNLAYQYTGSKAMHSGTVDTNKTSENKEKEAIVNNAGKAKKGIEIAGMKISTVFTAVKRYYSNNVLDRPKQAAYDIFLGNFIAGKFRHYFAWDENIDNHSYKGHRQDVDLLFTYKPKNPSPEENQKDYIMFERAKAMSMTNAKEKKKMNQNKI